MSSPHLIRHFTAAQLSLVADHQGVAVLAAGGDRYGGTAVLAHLPTLRWRLDWLDGAVTTVVVIDDVLPDAATIGRIDDMVTVYLDLEVDALTDWVPATEALKVERDGVVDHGVDRSDVVSGRCPVVFDRAVLTRAVTAADDDVIWIDPTAAVARAGGRVALFEPSMLPSWLQTL